MTTLIVLAVGIIAMLIVAFLSSKSWHWGHVSLVVGVFFSGVLLMVLAAETIRIHHTFRSRIRVDREQIEQLTAENAALGYGTRDSSVIGRLRGKGTTLQGDQLPGIANVDHQLQMVARRRGRVWRNAKPTGNVNAATGEVVVQVPPQVVAAPEPADGQPLDEGDGGGAPAVAAPTPGTRGIEKGMILFVFERGLPNPSNLPQSANYVGEFQVTDINDQQLKMVPVLWYSWPNRQRARLAAAAKRSVWELYETMPPDEWELFAVAREGQSGFTPQELQGLLPKSSLPEYLRHDTPATEQDPAERRRAYSETGKRLLEENVAAAEQAGQTLQWRFERELRDYSYLFQAYAQQRARMLAEIEAARNDIQRLEGALAVAKEQAQFRTAQIERLQADLQGFTKERAAAQRHAEQVIEQRTVAGSILEETLASNRTMAAQLARAQLEIAAALEAGTAQPTPAEGASELDVEPPSL